MESEPQHLRSLFEICKLNIVKCIFGGCPLLFGIRRIFFFFFLILALILSCSMLVLENNFAVSWYASCHALLSSWGSPGTFEERQTFPDFRYSRQGSIKIPCQIWGFTTEWWKFASICEYRESKGRFEHWICSKFPADKKNCFRPLKQLVSIFATLCDLEQPLTKKRNINSNIVISGL